jgi:hypothetical protein
LVFIGQSSPINKSAALDKFCAGVGKNMAYNMTEKDLHTPSSEAHGGAAMLQAFGLARAESMEMRNDPRFFTDNVVNYRIAAFGTMSIVSGLMIGTAMSDIMGMDKNINCTHWVGALQFVSFGMLLLVFFFNMVGTYVGVAQPYHVMRLLTSGPTGFEAAASYYLNKNIITWRHFAIKYMLVSLPLYIVQMGLRLVVKFDRSNKKGPETTVNAPFYSDFEGIFFCVLLMIMGMVLWCVHCTHFAVFRERYSTMLTPSAFTQHVQSMAMPGMRTQVNTNYLASNLDV